MSKELLKQALDALVRMDKQSPYPVEPRLIDAIRAALAAPEAEPVAWGMLRPDGLLLDAICPDERDVYAGAYTVPLYVIPQQAQPTENPWKDAVLDRLASASIDAPTDEFPSRILDRIIEVEVMIALSHVPDGWMMVPRELFPSQLIASIVAAIRASDSNPVCSADEVSAPTDWVMVPREPSDDMRQDGHTAWMRATQAALDSDPGLDVDGPHSNIAAGYRAMIAAAPAAPAVQPLTDEQIREIGKSLPVEHKFHSQMFARAIEQAHGITQQAQEGTV